MAKGDRQPVKADVSTKVEGRHKRVVVLPPPSYLSRLLGSAGVKPGPLELPIKAASRPATAVSVAVPVGAVEVAARVWAEVTDGRGVTLGPDGKEVLPKP
jgi:hypothetical protein